MSLMLTRAYDALVDDVRPRDRVVRAVVGTDALDRYRTVISAHGIRLDNWRRNPVICWEHGLDPNRGALPIGRGVKAEPIIGPNGPALVIETAFHTDEFANRLFEMYRAGDLRAWSVRVIPDMQHCSPPTRAEVRARPELADCEMCYRSSDLGEVSAVAVGGNPEALTLPEARSVLSLQARGLSLPPGLSAAARSIVGDGPGLLPPLTGRSFDEVRAELRSAGRAAFRGHDLRLRS